MKHRRGLSMYIVFLIVAMATLLASGLAYRAGADRDGAGHAVMAVQAEALVRSGIAGLMAELDAERPTILEGGEPRVTDQWSLYGTGIERGEIVLIPWESRDDDMARGRDLLIISESAKLNVNAATVEQLQTLFEAAGVVGDVRRMAEAVISARERLQTRRFLSLGDIVALGAVPGDVMWGRAESGGEMEGSEGQRRPLSELLTVHGYEPVLQETGKYKINVNAEWDDRMGRRIARRFGAELASLVYQVKQNEDFRITEEQLVQILAQSDNPPTEWDQYIDAFTDSDETIYHGRVDLNRAPAEVLQAVTGFDAETVSAIVSARSELSQRQQAGTAWLVESGIVEPAAWSQVATKLTTRTFVWRARVMGRILRGGSGPALQQQPPASVEAERVYEVVIDLSSPRARLAYVRDISMKDVAVRLSQMYGSLGETLDTSEASADHGPVDEPYDVSNRGGRSDSMVNRSEPESGDDSGEAASDGRSNQPRQADRSPSGRWTRGG